MTPPEAVAVEPEPPAQEVPRPSRPRTPRTPAPATDTRPDPPKPEPPATETPAVPAAEPSRPADSPSSALRTPQTANDAEAERRVRDVLGRASRGLEAVNRAQLSSDARAQFDTARRFIDQATDALKARNYMFAGYLADKAETLARGLAGR
jgi:hypothetical protein